MIHFWFWVSLFYQSLEFFWITYWNPSWVPYLIEDSRQTLRSILSPASYRQSCLWEEKETLRAPNQRFFHPTILHISKRDSLFLSNPYWIGLGQIKKGMGPPPMAYEMWMMELVRVTARRLGSSVTLLGGVPDPYEQRMIKSATPYFRPLSSAFCR